MGVVGLDEIVQRLRTEGRAVIAPTVRDGTITPDRIDSAAELPIGYTDDQDGGHYRLVPTGTDEYFASSSPIDSWKRFLSPPEALLVRGRSSSTDLEVEPVVPDPVAFAFVGIRACDLAAIGLLDRVFLAPDAVDPTYATRRREVFVVAVGCVHPGATCFCASMGTGPIPRDGYDLALTELYDGDRHEFLVDVGSDRGAAVMADVSGRPAVAADDEAAAARAERAVAAMGRQLDPLDPPRAAANPEHVGWGDVAGRCLSCGNCTMVCPTCFCSATQDRTALLGDGVERWRVWDSCFTADFSSLHGNPVRATTESRYRQWLLHKLVTWHDQFGSSGCVGCGRCITSCPVGIDLTAEIRVLAES